MSYWLQVYDPWTDAATYVHNPRADDERVYNADGSLVYPGRAVGYDGIAPSMRLKALRDGIEDYEYLAILERAGKKEEADAIVSGLAGSWFDWNRAPAAYEEARSALAQLIVSITR